MAPQPPKCCGCNPLRPGLLAWAYIKLVLAIASIGWFVFITRDEIHHFVDHVDYISRYHNPVVFLLQHFWPLGVYLLLLVFAILFIIGVHRQSYKLLLVYLVYSLFEIILAGAAIGWEVYTLVHSLPDRSQYDSKTYDRIMQNLIHDPNMYLGVILPFVINMLLPIYLIVLIKSEMQCLKTERGETRVVLDEPVTKEQDKTYNFVYSNETPDRRKPLFPVEELERLRQQLGVKNV